MKAIENGNGNGNGNGNHPSTRVYKGDAVGNLSFLAGTIAVIGYGPQGQAQALSLSFLNQNVIVGLRRNSLVAPVAVADGFTVYSVSQAVQQAGFILLADMSDNKQQEVYYDEIRPALSGGETLVFCNATPICSKAIIPPKNVNVIMVAPKGPSHIVRQRKGKGVHTLFAIHQDFTGTSRKIALAWAKAIGATLDGVVETTFSKKMESDLFVQNVLCADMSVIVQAAYETLIKAGHSPETASADCLRGLKMITGRMEDVGIDGIRTVPEVISAGVMKSMRNRLSGLEVGSVSQSN